MTAAVVEDAITDALAQLDELAATDGAVAPSAVASLRGVLREELDRLPGDGPLTGWSAGSLARVLVDGGGPQDPRHPIFAAFDAVEKAREQAALGTGRIQLLARSTVRQIVESDKRSRASIVQAASASGVLVPMIVEGDRQSMPLMRTNDGSPFVACFTDRELLDGWAEQQAHGLTVRASITTLAALRSHVQAAGAAGMVVNPLTESLVIPVPRSAEPAAGHRLSFGVPADPPADLVQALQDAAADVPDVTAVHLAALVDGDGPATLVAVVDGSSEDVLPRYGAALRSQLAVDRHVDLLDAATGVGRAIASDVPSLLPRRSNG